ncbi:MAG: GldG family protein [Spirochaetes bacterium]|nr:GldG family protein [Spirochaetota bacterium]
MTKKQTLTVSILTVAAIVLAIMVSHRLWFRIDLTRNRANTISAVSRNLHFELPDQVMITYYISDALRAIHPAPRAVEDLLREYAAFSRGMIRVFVRDPVRAGVSAQVEELGLTPRQIQMVELDQASFTTVYTGIVIEFMGNVEVIPWVLSTNTLEYDLTSRIRAMVRETPRRTGILIGDSFRSWIDDFGFLQQAFAGAGINTQILFPGEEIPDTLPSLFVIGGSEDLDEWDLFQIDRFIQLGGKVLFAVSGVHVDTLQGTAEARRLNDLGLIDMIASYGVTIRPELALDASALPLHFQTLTPAGQVQTRVIRYPHWVAVLGENGNPDHPISANSTGLDLFWPSPLELHPSENVEAVPLFTSTSDAWAMRDTFHTNPELPGLFELEAAQTRGTKILAASLSGTFPSFFAGTPFLEAWGDMFPVMPQYANPSRIIVVGETNFATNMLSVSGAVANLEFLIQAADWLAQDDDIIGIRNRQDAVNRLERIIDPYARYAAMFFSQVLNIVLVPLGVIITGLVLASRRRKRAAAFAAAQNTKE